MIIGLFGGIEYEPESSKLPVMSQSWVSHESVTSNFWGCNSGTPIGQEGVNFFNETEMNMSEHFLGSNKAFEMLANLRLDPLPTSF